jgi:hypothetical protein
LIREFRHDKDYWLDNCTLQDWRDIYSRELMERPSLEDWAAFYFQYNPPSEASAASTASEDGEMWECPFPDVTE